MRVSAQALATVVALSVASAFVIPGAFDSKKTQLFVTKTNSFHEFDYLLQEGGDSNTPLEQSVGHHRRVLLPSDRTTSSKQVQLTSTAAAATLDDDYNEFAAEQELSQEELTEAEQAEIGKIASYQEQQSTRSALTNYFANADLQELAWTLFVPAVVLSIGIKFAWGKAATKVEGDTDELLDGFAKEMLYHDGDFEEMKMCQKDYGRRLLWLGPKRNDAMLKRYLESYAKKKTVTPRAISSMSYVFSLFDLSEDQAANTLVSLCKSMGEVQVATAGKLLFFGSRILKSPEAKAKLTPIRDMIKGSYRDMGDGVASDIVEKSQHAMAEAAYRSTVQEKGSGQKSLTPGWELLGLDKETATRVFEEEGNKGFKTDRERMYEGQVFKYNKQGQRVDDNGKLVQQEDIDAEKANPSAGDDDDDSPTGNVMECGNCGYTMFIAKGRDVKFFGEGFTCPECGAARDVFKSRTIEED